MSRALTSRRLSRRATRRTATPSTPSSFATDGCSASTPTARSSRASTPTHACLIGAGGAARTLEPALPADTRRYSRSADWPPDATGCDLIVNATPVRDELLVIPVAGQTVVDLAYGPEETALVAAAQAAGCVVVDGFEALVRQGAASFRLWTGLEPPVEVMRAAIRPATR